MKNALVMSFLVGIGGFVGSISRYFLAIAGQRFSVVWPFGTFLANLLGCFCIGILTGISARGVLLAPELRLALATGFCGGLTTFSTFVYETGNFFTSGEYLHGAAYIILSFVLSMLLFYLGMTLVNIGFASK